MGKTSAIVIIGNEILSGKVRDENGPYLSAAFRALGVDVRQKIQGVWSLDVQSGE